MNVKGLQIKGLYVFLFLISASCSVNYSFTGADIPAEAKTVSVDFFTTLAPKANPTISQKFTDDLIAMLLTQANGLDVIKEDGDLQFSGAIVGYRISPAAVQSNTEAASQNRLTIVVKVKYTNTIEPDKSFEKEFSQFADYDVDNDLNVVEPALIDAIDKILVQDIFNASLGSW